MHSRKRRPLATAPRQLPATLLLLSVLLFTAPAASHAQWQPDVRLTNASFGSYTGQSNGWAVATNGTAVHVVWQDYRALNPEVYYKRSTDDGSTWSSDTRLTNDPAQSDPAVVAVSDQTVHVVWLDYRGGSPELYYKRSVDGGASWGADLPLTVLPADVESPSVAAAGQLVHVVWKDQRSIGGNNEIFYKRSTDGGTSWSTDLQLTNDPSIQNNPSIAISGPVVHVSWMDFRDSPSGNSEIYYKRSIDFGATWEPEARLTLDPAISSYPSIAASDAEVHIVWYETRDGNGEIYYKRSTNSGVSWFSDVRLTNESATSYTPSAAVSGANVHVVWRDSRDDDNGEIYYKVSTDGGASWDADTRLTENFQQSNGPSVAVSGPSLHVAWSDTRDGNPEIYYKHGAAGAVTGVIAPSGIPGKPVEVLHSYPNPFRLSTQVEWSLPRSGFATVEVFNVSGERVAQLVSEELASGRHSVEWTAGREAAGVYYCRLHVRLDERGGPSDFVETKKLILLP